MSIEINKDTWHFRVIKKTKYHIADKLLNGKPVTICQYWRNVCLGSLVIGGGWLGNAAAFLFLAAIVLITLWGAVINTIGSLFSLYTGIGVDSGWFIHEMMFAMLIFIVIWGFAETFGSRYPVKVFPDWWPNSLRFKKKSEKLLKLNQIYW